MINKLMSNVSIIEPPNGLDEKLALARREKRSLIVKLGFDPTSPDLHLGHSVVLQKLKDFQDAGHTIVVIVGDFTARIGDPTGRNQTRPPLTPEQINVNAKTYISQLSRVLDVSKVEVKRNSAWLDKLNLSETIKLISEVTLAQIMQREDFKTRFRGDQPISLHELMYPIMQGYDSVIINADIELGGTDQLFNCMMGRTLQKIRGLPEQTVICMPLLVGLDGKEKMSKSKANYIGLTETPENIYGKVMSISDVTIPDYINLATMFESDEKAKLFAALNTSGNPMSVKKLVAYNIVERFYDVQAADAAAEHFERTVQKRNFKDEDFQTVQISDFVARLSTPFTVVDVSALLVPSISKSDIRRLIKGGGIRVSGVKVDEPTQVIDIKPDVTIHIGRRSMFRFQ